jgi:hypothetical protein
VVPKNVLEFLDKIFFYHARNQNATKDKLKLQNISFFWGFRPEI